MGVQGDLVQLWGCRWRGAGMVPTSTGRLESKHHLPSLLVHGSAGADALGQVRTWWSHPTTSPCARAGCVLGSSWSTPPPPWPHPQMPVIHHPLLQKGPPSSANKPLQVTLLGKPGSFINIHNVNCCNWKAGFPLLGMWVCAVVWKCAEECEGRIAPVVVMVTTGLCCVWVRVLKEQ